MNPGDILAQIITAVKFMGMRKIEGLILPPSGQRSFTGMEDTGMIFEGTESPEGPGVATCNVAEILGMLGCELRYGMTTFQIWILFCYPVEGFAEKKVLLRSAFQKVS